MKTAPLSLIPNLFRYQKFAETKKGSSTIFFGTVRQNNFDAKSWYPPPLLYLTCFDTKNFLKLRRVPLPNVPVLWDKTFLTENRDTHSLFIQNFFRYRKFSVTQHRRVSLQTFSALWNKTILMENRDTRALSHPYHFSEAESFWN